LHVPEQHCSSSPNQETPTSSSAPSIAEVPRTESIRAVVVGPYDEDPTTLPEYQPTAPQFIEPLDTDDYEKETKELLSQVPSQQHEYLDIFRKKGSTETLPPPRPYDMRIDLLPSAKLAVAKLYQLTEDQRMILLDTLKRETFDRHPQTSPNFNETNLVSTDEPKRHRMQPSTGTISQASSAKRIYEKCCIDRLVQRLQVHHTPLQHPSSPDPPHHTSPPTIRVFLPQRQGTFNVIQSCLAGIRAGTIIENGFASTEGYSTGRGYSLARTLRYGEGADCHDRESKLG